MPIRFRHVVAALLLGAVGVAGAQSPSWFDPAKSTEQNAERARREGLNPADTTRGLIQSGEDPAHSVRAVIASFNQCDAVFDSVRVGSEMAPSRAADLVQAATAGGRCPCQGENLWAAARLEQRVRIEHRQVPVEIFSSCGCSGAAAQAAVGAAPDQAERVIAAAIAAQRKAGGVVDSIGQVGSAYGPLAAGGGGLVRRQQQCARDTNPDDAFDAARDFSPAQLDPANLAATSNSLCQDDEGHSGEDEDEGLMIEGVVADAGNHVIVLRNGSDKAVDLGSENYQVELFFPAASDSGRKIPIGGRVEPKGLYVVAGDGATQAWRDRADLVVPSTLLQPAEAIVLRRGLTDAGCGCANVAVAGTLNGLGPRAEEWREDQDQERPLSTADSLGRVRPESVSNSDWRPPLADVPQQWVRKEGACDGDGEPEDPFAPEQFWTNGTEFSARCANHGDGVVIARYDAQPTDQGDSLYRSVELFNNAGRPIDLRDEGYVLEVYADGERNPREVVPLQGQVDKDGRYLVASSSAPDAIREQAALVRDELSLSRVDAVVIRRLAVRTGGSCDVDVYAALQELGPTPIPLIPPIQPRLPGAPRSDEPVIDPDRGGDLASPN